MSGTGSDDEALEQLRALASRTREHPVKAFERLRREVGAELEGMGWPPLDAQVTVTADGAWRLTEDLERELAGGNVQIMPGRRWIRESVDIESKEWLLIEIADRCTYALGALRENDAVEACRETLWLGDALRWLDTFRHVSAGRKSNAGADRANNRRSRESFHAVHGETAFARYLEIKAEKRLLPNDQIERMVAKELGISHSTVKRSLIKSKKLDRARR